MEQNSFLPPLRRIFSHFAQVAVVQTRRRVDGIRSCPAGGDRLRDDTFRELLATLW